MNKKRYLEYHSGKKVIDVTGMSIKKILKNFSIFTVALVVILGFISYIRVGYVDYNDSFDVWLISSLAYLSVLVLFELRNKTGKNTSGE
ncbi:hypothetical protein [Brevibacillus sp. MER 51]|uniref:hypothetical protein n=1 Tax=Brevibacillus sp. MER 51 TaxID=2939560 RepID=UPI00204178BE|nr:hypothetical protein [Brevibacillus sp. MER 51]MCM3141273.1 hypothetical protein [Brevibacillus sp. MER 51]